MSELSRAVAAEAAAFEPDRVPPFAEVLATRRTRARRTRAAAAVMAVGVIAGGGALAASLISGPDTLTTVVAGPSTPTAPAPVAVDTLGPPAGADTLVLCLSGAPSLGRADCAVVRDSEQLVAVGEELASARGFPRPELVCAIGAADFDLVWLGGEQVLDRVAVPAATCLYASRSREDEQVFGVSQALIDTLVGLHAAQAGAGGAFDGLDDPAPAAATCVQNYPDDLGTMPLAVDVVVLGVTDTDPAEVPESPGVPFSDLDVLVLDRYAGQPAERLVVRTNGRPEPSTAVGERLLIANTSPFLAACGFTQPYSRETAFDWRDAFG